MLDITSIQRRELRAVAHHLNPVVSIADNGLSPSVLKEIARNLAAHGLIKIRVYGADREVRSAWMTEICESLDAAPVQMIGNLLVVYRPLAESAAKPAAKNAKSKASPKKAATQQSSSGKSGTSSRRSDDRSTGSRTTSSRTTSGRSTTGANRSRTSGEGYSRSSSSRSTTGSRTGTGTGSSRSTSSRSTSSRTGEARSEGSRSVPRSAPRSSISRSFAGAGRQSLRRSAAARKKS